MKLNTNKGFLLLELIISAAISILLVTITIKLLFYIFTNYNEYLSTNRVESYSLSSLDIVDELISSAEPNSINVNNNVISYIYQNNKREIVKKISSDGTSELVINYYSNGLYTNKNIIQKKINGFSVVKKGGVIYVSIINEKKRGFNKCIKVL